MKLLIGGSPCTYWSIAQIGNRETKAEGLGWELFKNYLIAKEKWKPDYFLYENNKSASEAIKNQIKEEFEVMQGGCQTNIFDNGVRFTYINSALVSAQNRQRFYVTNFGEIEQPEDRCILLKDVLDAEPVNMCEGVKSHTLKAGYYKAGMAIAITNGGYKSTFVAEPYIEKEIPKIVDKIGYCPEMMNGYNHSEITEKSPTLTTACGISSSSSCIHIVVKNKDAVKRVYDVKDGYITIKGKQYPIKLKDGQYIIRKCTVSECMRLQTIPEWYAFPVSNSQAYKMIGNGWTVEVIKHLLSHIPNIQNEPIEVLSMYDGMSCGQIALKEMGCNVVKYTAYEINKYAIQTTQYNFPNTIQKGDAFQVRNDDWSI